MARVHGRSGVLKVELTVGEAVETVAFLNKWSLSFAADRVDVTAMGDTNKVYLAGLPDASGDFAGFYDAAADAVTLEDAAMDGVARDFELYPAGIGAGKPKYVGTAIFDFKVDSGVGEAVTVSGSWAASSNVVKSTQV
jgi:predicted secreted protein